MLDKNKVYYEDRMCGLMRIYYRERPGRDERVSIKGLSKEDVENIPSREDYYASKLERIGESIQKLSISLS